MFVADAVIIALLRLGLRRGKLAWLTLDDIDWEAAELAVRGKDREDRLPLPADVGAAIAAYLKRGRPASDRRATQARIWRQRGVRRVQPSPDRSSARVAKLRGIRDNTRGGRTYDRQ